MDVITNFFKMMIDTRMKKMGILKTTGMNPNALKKSTRNKFVSM